MRRKTPTISSPKNSSSNAINAGVPVKPRAAILPQPAAISSPVKFASRHALMTHFKPSVSPVLLKVTRPVFLPSMAPSSLRVNPPIKVGQTPSVKEGAPKSAVQHSPTLTDRPLSATCKPRPDVNKGGGGSRAFVPWCDRSK